MRDPDAEDGKLRLFAAIELPDEWVTVLGGIRSRLERTAAGELRWVRPDLMHLTLVFLGYQTTATLPSIDSAMKATAGGGAPFELSMDRLGSFGPPHAMTVLWAGLTDPSSGLVGLHRRVSDQLTDRHIAFDPKPLAPHITLARAKRPIDRTVSLRLATAIQQIRIPAGLSTTVERFVLMRSHLSPKGPTYEVLNHFLIGRRQ